MSFRPHEDVTCDRFAYSERSAATGELTCIHCSGDIGWHEDAGCYLCESCGCELVNENDISDGGAL